MSENLNSLATKRASTGDNSSITETEGLYNTLYINLVLFSFLMTFFEINRNMKSTYLKRVTKKFQVRLILYRYEQGGIIDMILLIPP